MLRQLRYHATLTYSVRQIASENRGPITAQFDVIRLLGGAMADQETNRWRAFYVAAYLERDPARVTGRIEEAEEAMAQRQEETAVNRRNRNVEAERRTLALCLQDLRMLRQRCSSPHSEATK